MKIETLEEIAERLYPDGCDGTTTSAEIYRRLWIEGAKWQQERSYSEEDMIIFAEWIRDNKFSTCPDKDENSEEWFEQFKKK